MAERDPITCHVLDTTTGRPGASISVELTCLSSPSQTFQGTTNSDGRITKWTSPVAQDTIQSLIESQGEGSQDRSVPAGSSSWKLKFQTGEYYGITKTFFPVVELTFLVKEGEHFHVPLLLGPHSFTTYRGS